MVVKKKSKVTTALIPVLFLIGIIAIVTPVNACYTNRIYIMAIGDDLDLPRTSNFIIGNIKFSGDSEPPSAGVFFYSKIYGESGEKYAMLGMLKNGFLIMTDFEFYCPIFDVWWINVWWVMGEGIFRTTDTDIEVYFRESLTIAMPNTEGQCVPASIFMWLSPTAEYRESEGNPTDPENPLRPTGPVKIWEQGGWALAGVFWDVGIPMDFGFGVGILPIGPLSYLTISIGI